MNYFSALALGLFAYMNGWFVASVVKKRNDVADVAWGLGFVLLAWMSFLIAPAAGARGALAGVLVSIWGVRLAWHIFQRNRNKPEDPRYQAWRQAWGKWVWVRSYFQVYLLQGALLFLIALPVLMINNHVGKPWGLIDLAGIAIWGVGFFFESVGDAQLARFIKNPDNRGKLMQSGLWRYSRHPNYFGEVVQWWGIWLSALAVPNGWITVVGPLTITLLILKVSGIPMLEKKMALHPDYAMYARRVSSFFPRPPKKV